MLDLCKRACLLLVRLIGWEAQETTTTAPFQTNSIIPVTTYSTTTIHTSGGNGGGGVSNPGGGSGMPRADKIALGVGLSVPLATLAFMVWKWISKRSSDRTTHAVRMRNSAQRRAHGVPARNLTHNSAPEIFADQTIFQSFELR
jgi:hypothetical protein